MSAGQEHPSPGEDPDVPDLGGEEELTVEDVLAEAGSEPGSEAGVEGSGDEPEEDPGDELAAARLQAEEYLGSLQRLQADFENYRKRVAKQQAEAADRANEALVGKLLPVLDVADLAMAHGAGEGVEQVWSALIEALEREGLERIDPPAGGMFDPNRHDAVAHEPGEDGASQQVAELLRAGYAWKGRVIRAAMVKVRG